MLNLDVRCSLYAADFIEPVATFLAISQVVLATLVICTQEGA